MPKKKVTHFTLFVDEVLRPDRLARGENPSFKQLLDESFKVFPTLPAEVQEYYRSRASESRNVNLAAEFFPQAKRQPIAENSAFKAVDLNAENEKDEIIAKNVHQRIFKFSSKKELKSKEFIFASVQCFLNTQPHVRPVEIAMVKWSMDKGIIDQFSELVHPGEIPLGLRASLKEFAEATHMFTEEAFALGTRDYNALWSRVMKFITYEGVIEPIYSFKPLSCHLVSLCLNWLNDQACGRRVALTVDPTEHLYKELLLHVGHDVDFKVVKEFLSRYNFDISDSLRCPFHANRQCEFCAKAFCLKPVYNMLSSLQQYYLFELTQNHKQVEKVVISTDRANALPIKPDLLRNQKEGEETRRVSFRNVRREVRVEKSEPLDSRMDVDEVSIDGCPAPKIALDFPDENQWPALSRSGASRPNPSGVAKNSKTFPGFGRGRGKFL